MIIPLDFVNTIFVIIVVIMGICRMTVELGLGVGNVNHPITRHECHDTPKHKVGTGRPTAESRGALKENWRCGREYSDTPKSPPRLCNYDFYMSY